jgi:hypothetical protein
LTSVVLDDHLLRDLLADDVGPELAEVLAQFEPATTNLFLVRLCKSVVSARGGSLTGSWSATARSALGQRLVALPDRVRVVPMTDLAFDMATVARDHRVSTLGAEAVAAAIRLGGPLGVWAGDDGPGIRAAADAAGVPYRTIARTTTATS